MTNILECRNISHAFGRLTALSEVTLRVPEGEIVGVIGPNGAGKTTLFNIISGVIRPSGGNVVFSGRDITGLDPGRICKVGIARTYQLVRPFPSMTVLENTLVGVCFGRRAPVSLRDGMDLASAELEFVGLEERSRHLADNLTLAEKRLLEMARALATDPRVILLDEVVAGLTPLEATRLQDVVRRIQARGITVVMIEHVMRAVMELCQSVCVLDFGRLIACGTPDEVVSDREVIAAYLGPSEAGSGGRGA